MCGWLLPNHIDKSISVYEAGGDLLGGLYLIIKGGDERAVYWQPAPGAPDVSPAGDQGEELGIANPHLKAMIEPLIHRDDNGAAFGNLLKVQVSFSVPRLTLESLRGVLESLAVDHEELRYAIVIHAAFRLRDSAVTGYLVMVLGVASLDRLLRTLDSWNKAEH